MADKKNDISLDEIKARVHQYLVSKTDFLTIKDTLNDDQMRLYIDRVITEICMNADLSITLIERQELTRQMTTSMVSLGPLREIMGDATVSEIMINGPKDIYVQRFGKITKTDLSFKDTDHLLHFVQKMLSSSKAARRVDESSPYVDFALPDGSRVNVIIQPCSLVGPVITIRKFDNELDTLDNLIEKGTLNQQIAMFLVAAIKAKLNIVICGATGSGKTTLLNILSHHIPEEERIITIEDTAELRLSQEHVVPLQAKASNIEGKGEITIRDLFVNSLRMRPDRIIVGEVRGKEILDMIQSIASGHSGALGIIHAESPDECFNRMTTMMLMTDIGLSVEEIQRQIASAVDLIVHVELYMDGTRRVTNVTDVDFNKETGAIKLTDIFTFVQEDIEQNTGVIRGNWPQNKKKPSSYIKFLKRFVEFPEGFFN